MPSSRSVRSFARRSAINWFSSLEASSVIVILWERPLAAIGLRGSRGQRPLLQYQSGGVAALGAGGEAGLQAGLEEFVDVAVEDLLRVGALDARAQILDAALVEHVVADLRAPADVRLAGFQRVAFDVALLDLHLVQLRLQHLHRGVAVLVLRAAGLAGHDDAG